MARYVVVEIDDDERARRFGDKLLADDAAGKGWRMVGLFGKPTKFCLPETCPDYASKETARSAQHNWWVHRACRRPKPGYQAPRNLLYPLGRAREISFFLHSREATDRLEAMGFHPPPLSISVTTEGTGKRTGAPLDGR